MATLDSESTPIGTHPSFASSHTVVECDRCGKVFHADCCISDQWEFHGEQVGLRDYSGGDAEDLCLACESELFGEE